MTSESEAGELEPPRVTICVRVSVAALKVIDEMAERDDRSRSEMIRRLLAYAVWKMPPGWRPPRSYRSY